ncbi:MAG: STAS domain-containing protein [Phycisphaerales bacterium]|jgi:anti-sigma B factor antagonist|nr:anti-anti-sigma factor [Planctomycetaceae bacterium]MDP6157626.1 STAS domain-containing protein [Phycisphaerales bacterium]MDP6311958.1 STAS domain-containing protein [Phycisphaerales bacterium]MDP7087093.1 STAS domain-containing protein [Phycisphaerales bacterium]MDP7189041.1 STAS domain-containing protein [Phycisphaerales bacterium]|tara:strand:- start:108 stop:449 length:342 start_codon:yes stop_codon:yes gene_type:complete
MREDNSGSLSISIDQGHDQLVVTPVGEIDLSTSPQLRQTLQTALADGDTTVIVDLAEVPYMDSSGVATLVEALQICRRQHRELVLARLSSRVESIFKISKLDAVFTIRDDLND